MECSAETLQVLDDLQAVDFTILHLKRKFDTLPQRQKILQLRQNIHDVCERKAKAVDLVDEAQEKVNDVLEDDATLEKRQKAIQEQLDQAKGNFRDVEAKTKELASVAKQRETLNHKLTTYEAELDKVQAVLQKIEEALAQLEEAEAAEVSSFKAEGTALQQQIARAKAERETIAPKLDPSLLTLYEKTAARCGGVGVAHLEGSTCSVCHGPLDKAHVHQARHDAPLTTCPLCRRLLIVRD